MRALSLWAVLFAAYAATLGIGAFRDSRYGGDEPHYLLAAESLVSDGDFDLRDEYASRAYAGFYPYTLAPDGQLTLGRRHEPHGIGFPVLIAPAYALGGATLVQLVLAAIAALGFVLAALLARRIVPEPWPTAAALLTGLSPPALAYGATVYPELVAGTLLAGAALAALALRDRPRLHFAIGGAVLLALLPWLGPKYALAALPVAVMLVRWTARRGRRLAAIATAEVMLGSLVFYFSLNDRFFGGLTPYSANAAGDSPTGAEVPLDYVDRLPRLAALWIDRDYGLLRWAPVFALSFFAAWLLWRSHRSLVARLAPERLDAEVAASLLLAICVGQVLAAAFVAPTAAGDWFPGRQLVAALPAAAALAAWGLRRAPRTGAVLGALTLLAGAWLAGGLAADSVDGWIGAPASTAPWGPAERLLPLYAGDSPWPDIASALLAAGLLALLAWEWWRWRSDTPAGAYFRD